METTYLTTGFRYIHPDLAPERVVLRPPTQSDPLPPVHLIADEIEARLRTIIIRNDAVKDKLETTASLTSLLDKFSLNEHGLNLKGIKREKLIAEIKRSRSGIAFGANEPFIGSSDEETIRILKELIIQKDLYYAAVNAESPGTESIKRVEGGNAVESGTVKVVAVPQIKPIQFTPRVQNAIQRPETALDKTRRQAMHSPWLAKMNWDQPWQNSLEILDEELQLFLAYLSPTQAEAEFRGQVITTLSSICQSIWPESTVDVFGSCSTGLFLPDADIDVGVYCDSFATMRTGLIMDRLSSALKDSGFCSKLQNIRHAKVPIIKITTAPVFGSFDIDISFGNPGGPLGARRMIELREEITRKSSRSDCDHLDCTVLLIKLFLRSKMLHETKHGGIGGMSIFLLVVSLLQLAPELTDLAQTLVIFLEYYSSFNFSKLTITTADGGRYLDRISTFGLAGTTGRVRMSLQHPIDLKRDMTSASSSTYLILEAFRALHSSLSKYRTDSTPQALDSILLEKESALISMGIKVNQGFINKRRLRIRDYISGTRDGVFSASRSEMSPYLLANLEKKSIPKVRPVKRTFVARASQQQ